MQLSMGAALTTARLPLGTYAAWNEPKSGGEKIIRDPDSITVFLCGDVMTGRGIDQVLPHPGSPRICERYTTSAKAYVRLAEEAHGPITKPVDFAYIWGDALPELARRSPDLRIINLETSITKSEDCTDKGISYRMSPENIPSLTVAGVDCCTLANNHVLDWGRAGLVETLDTLVGAGIKSVGAGRDSREAAAPAMLTVPGKGRVLVFAFGSITSGIPRNWAAGPGIPGINFLGDLSRTSLERSVKQVLAARQPGDLVIVSIHWGENWGYHIPPEQRDFARGLIEEADVNVVFGHSSHHAKGIQVYQDRPIFYGSGDFLDDYEGIGGYERFRDDLVLMYLLTFAPSTGKLVGCEMIPFQIRNMRLNRSSVKDARWLQDVLNKEGEALGSRVEVGEDNTLVLRWR